MHKILLAPVGSVLLMSCGLADGPEISVNDAMVEQITPATNTLWGIENPQTDEEWQVFIDAANVVIETTESIKQGGTGPNDNSWAQDPDWQAFADRLIAAGIDARTAAENKDVDAMYAAGDVLYAPCEECHIQFHPGVQQE
ncbi:MAG: hypothetical protein ACR2QT_07190 [Woeseiaceae bacterium]